MWLLHVSVHSDYHQGAYAHIAVAMCASVCSVCTGCCAAHSTQYTHTAHIATAQQQF
jgi:hypothetical protein